MPLFDARRNRVCPQPCHYGAQPVDDVRRLISAAVETVQAHSLRRADDRGLPATIDRWPVDAPSTEDAVREFVPTAVFMSWIERDPHVRIEASEDHNSPSRFLTCAHVIETIRHCLSGRVKRMASQVFTGPPAVPSDSRLRAELLASLGKGVPLNSADGGRNFLLTGKLTPEEMCRARGAALDEQIALVAVLAAHDGLALMFSRDGTWPESRLVAGVAERLGCRFVRFSFGNVPPVVVRRLRNARYEAESR